MISKHLGFLRSSIGSVEARIDVGLDRVEWDLLCTDGAVGGALGLNIGLIVGGIGTISLLLI